MGRKEDFWIPSFTSSQRILTEGQNPKTFQFLEDEYILYFMENVSLKY